MLPPELEEEILSHLWNDTKALKSCALTRRSFQNPAQKLLYSEINLWFSSLEESTTSTLVDILDANPQLRHYVRRLEIIISFRKCLLNDSSILRVLLLLDNLQALVIESRNEDIVWPDSFLSTFLTIIHRSSLESLSMTDLPLELIKHGQRLTHLAVRQLSSQSLPPGSCTSCTEKLGLDTLDLLEFISPEFVQLLLADVIQTERIRNLQAYTSVGIEEHHALWEIVRPCAGRLKTLAFAPCEEIRTGADYSAKEDPIVWSAFTSLRCLAIRVDLATGHADIEYMRPQRWEEFECYTWMFKVLDQLSSSNQCLEEVFLFLHFDFGKELAFYCDDARHIWSKSIALLLNKSRFPCLKRLDAYFIDSTWFMNEFLLDCTEQLKHSQSQVDIQLYEFDSKFRIVSSDFMWSEVLPMLAWGDSSIDVI